MLHSSIFCRAQEAVQARRAAEAVLANVRSIATTAAAAWRAEAVLAEQREKRRRAQSAALPASRPSAWDEGALSENPDRGFADLARL